MTIPAVRSSIAGEGTFTLSSGDVVAASPALLDIVHIFTADLATDAGVALIPETIADAATPAVTVVLDAPRLAGIPLASGLRADGLAPQDADERYSLTIDASGIVVSASTAEGVHRGLTTLRQLVSAAAHAGTAQLPVTRISDGPRYAWRGLSVDVARTFHDAESVRRIIDMCSLYKLNVLHLHLTDDPGWRFEVPKWPLLTEIGGAGALGDRPGGFYTRAEIAGLVRYASERFITIVPEVDMPGHTQAVFRAYPELAPEPTETSAAAAASGFAIGTLDLDRGPTRQFVHDVIAALVEQFPTSAYIHIGGDEAFGMGDEEHAAFVDVALETVKRMGKRAMGWQEAGRAHVGPDDIVQYWIEPNEMASAMEGGAMASMVPPELATVLAETFKKSFSDVPTALAKGAWVLVSPMTRVYLDRPHAGPAATAEQEEQRIRVGLPFYPGTTLRSTVEWDAVTETPGVESDERIAGIEAAVWCETVTNRDDLEFLLLPRLAGVGERGWSAGPTEWDDYARRLASAPKTWDRRGWYWFRPAEADWLS